MIILKTTFARHTKWLIGRTLKVSEAQWFLYLLLADLIMKVLGITSKTNSLRCLSISFLRVHSCKDTLLSFCPPLLHPHRAQESLHQRVSMSSKAPVMYLTSIDLFVSQSAFLACCNEAFQTMGKYSLFPSYITGGNSCVSKKVLNRNYCWRAM